MAYVVASAGNNRRWCVRYSRMILPPNWGLCAAYRTAMVTPILQASTAPWAMSIRPADGKVHRMSNDCLVSMNKDTARGSREIGDKSVLRGNAHLW